MINVLTNQRRLAFASKTPGRTQLLNFFALHCRDRAGALEPCAYLVDLPGYGFARVDAAIRARWDRLVGSYLQTRRMLAGVVLDANESEWFFNLEAERRIGEDFFAEARVRIFNGDADGQLGFFDKEDYVEVSVARYF